MIEHLGYSFEGDEMMRLNLLFIVDCRVLDLIIIAAVMLFLAFIGFCRHSFIPSICFAYDLIF